MMLIQKLPTRKTLFYFVSERYLFEFRNILTRDNGAQHTIDGLRNQNLSTLDFFADVPRHFGWDKIDDG